MPHSGKKFRQAHVLRLQADAPQHELADVRSRTRVAGFVPDSGGLDLVSGFAFFVEVAADPARLYLPAIGKSAY